MKPRITLTEYGLSHTGIRPADIPKGTRIRMALFSADDDADYLVVDSGDDFITMEPV